MDKSKNIKYKSIQYKTIFLFAIVFFIPMALLMFLSIRRISNVSNKDLKHNLNYALTLYRDAFEDRLDSLKIRAKTLADFDFYEMLRRDDLDSEVVQQALLHELAKSALDYIAIVSNKSIVKFDEGTSPSELLNRVFIPAICSSALNSNLYIIGEDAWFFAAAKISKIQSDETTHIVFCQKIPHDFGDKLKRLTGADYSLMNGTKQIMSTKMDAFGRREIGVNIPNAENKEGTYKVSNKNFHFIREGILPGKIDEAIRVEIDIPDSEYKKLKNKMSRDFILFFIIGIGLALTTGYLLSKNIAEPINNLALLSTKVAKGILSFDPKITRDDEIGTLASNFREMLISIKKEKDQKEQRMNELNTLFSISNAVNYFTDSEELLKFVLTHAIDVVGAERGSIMLLDDETDELVIKVASGGRYRAFQSPPVKIGQGICGLVAQDGEGIICNEGFRDKRFSNFDSIMPVEDIITLICAPLKFKDGTIGVINIVNKRGGGKFNKNDLDLLNLIGSQAAVTIENNKLYELSITDNLTKLFVNRYFQARLSEEILRARRYGLTLGLLIIDIDNFKSFNETYGQQAGDNALQRIALKIKTTIRTGVDIPCRFDGEKIAVILPETKAAEALQTAERIKLSISEMAIPHEEKNLTITVSIGASSYPTLAHDKDSLIRSCEQAMYISKSNGKNKCTLAENSNDNSNEKA